MTACKILHTALGRLIDGNVFDVEKITVKDLKIEVILETIDSFPEENVQISPSVRRLRAYLRSIGFIVKRFRQNENGFIRAHCEIKRMG